MPPFSDGMIICSDDEAEDENDLVEDDGVDDVEIDAVDEVVVDDGGVFDVGIEDVDDFGVKNDCVDIENEEDGVGTDDDFGVDVFDGVLERKSVDNDGLEGIKNDVDGDGDGDNDENDDKLVDEFEDVDGVEVLDDGVEGVLFPFEIADAIFDLFAISGPGS